MKISKILAGMSAAALAASMLSMVSFADDTVEDYVVPAAQIRDNTVYLVGDAEKGEDGPFNDNVAELAKYNTYTMTIQAEDPSVITAAVANGDWIGGGIALNSDSTGWAATEWSFQDGAKPLTWASTGTDGEYEVTFTAADNGTLFAADDTYAQIAFQDWTGVTPLTITGVTLSYVAPSNDPELTAFLMYTDSSWAWGNWNPGTTGATDTTVKGDGTYTVSIAKGMLGGDDGVTDVTTNPAAGAMVFCVDIVDAYGEGNYSLDDTITATVDEVVMDKGTDAETELAVDSSKVLTGNIEDDGTNYRIELYNEYGDTKANPPVDTASIAFTDSLEVTFTLDVPFIPYDPSSSDTSSEAASSEETSESTSEAESTSTSEAASTTDVKTSSSSKAASTTTSTNPNTGAAALAAVGIALAGAAVVATKKRK